jgi:ABC-type branched-subunit amino acid transport system substrate-binding protein
VRPAAPGAKLLDAYKAKYGADPATNYALYGVSAIQVILEAIKKSDGTRKGVRTRSSRATASPSRPRTRSSARRSRSTRSPVTSTR